MQLMSRTAGRPNKPMHPTPLRVDKIGRILESDLGSIRTPIYTAARVMGMPLGGIFNKRYYSYAISACAKMHSM